MDAPIGSLIFRTSEIWKRSAAANVYDEVLLCAAFSPVPSFDLDSLLPTNPLLAIRMIEDADWPSLLEEVFVIKTGRHRVIDSDKGLVLASATP